MMKTHLNRTGHRLFFCRDRGHSRLFPVGQVFACIIIRAWDFVGSSVPVFEQFHAKLLEHRTVSRRGLFKPFPVGQIMDCRAPAGS